MKHCLRPAFTLIEVIVSVLLISIVIISVLEISSRSAETAMYLAHRNKAAFGDSLFLDADIARYHKDTKNAYDLLYAKIKTLKDDSKEILKSTSRNIIVPEPLIIPVFEGMSFENTPLQDMGLENMEIEATISKDILKDQYASTYFRFDLSLPGSLLSPTGAAPATPTQNTNP